VREVRGGERLGCDPAGLEELQRDLAGGRELGSAPHDEHAARERERQRHGRDPGLELGDERPELDRGGTEPFEVAVTGTGGVGRQQSEGCELVQVRLRRRDGVLVTGM
jgi:hypothetical protein